MVKRKAWCRKHNEYYEYVETRIGGYNGAWSSLVHGEYHFYRCSHGCIFAEDSKEPIRVDEE